MTGGVGVDVFGVFVRVSLAGVGLGFCRLLMGLPLKVIVVGLGGGGGLSKLWVDAEGLLIAASCSRTKLLRSLLLVFDVSGTRLILPEVGRRSVSCVDVLLAESASVTVVSLALSCVRKYPLTTVNKTTAATNAIL